MQTKKTPNQTKQNKAPTDTNFTKLALQKKKKVDLSSYSLFESKWGQILNCLPHVFLR